MIRTRFAPSPTGYLHIGGLRTALYCYLFAKANNGQLILRIEDTDQERFVPDALENLIKTLQWIGLNYDEGPLLDGTEKGNHGPYIQSKRTESYQKYAAELIEKGQAYRCFCTKERLDEMRQRQIENKAAPMYDRRCLDLPKSEIKAKIQAGEKFVIRQKIPYKLIKFKDLIRGNVQFDGKTIDDQVLVKSDGFPTYHLANVIDDHLMQITHAIRGEEWLPSTPKHLSLYEAFGWEPPQFAHLPLLLNLDRTKLSKRQGHVSVEEYIQEGYLKEAIINFGALLGWNPGGGEENEIFSLAELEKVFSLEKVHKAGAIFNIEKLDWFNWRWRKRKYLEELGAKANDPKLRAEKLYKICASELPENFKKDQEKLSRALVTIEEKILKNPKESAEHLKFYFELPNYDQPLLANGKMKVDETQAKKSLQAAQETLQKVKNWDLSTLEKSLLQTVADLKIKNGQLLWPVRVALTGQQFSPGAFEVLWVLGKEESLKRIIEALKDPLKNMVT